MLRWERPGRAMGGGGMGIRLGPAPPHLPGATSRPTSPERGASPERDGPRRRCAAPGRSLRRPSNCALPRMPLHRRRLRVRSVQHMVAGRTIVAQEVQMQPAMLTERWQTSAIGGCHLRKWRRGRITTIRPRRSLARTRAQVWLHMSVRLLGESGSADTGPSPHRWSLIGSAPALWAHMTVT